MPAHRILVVHGTPGVTRQLADTLARIGYDVAASSGSAADALALPESARPDLVLLSSPDFASEDVPSEGVASGDAAGASQIRRRWAAPIVFLLDTDPDAATARRLGLTPPFGYVVKPYTDRELQMNIEMARQARQLEDRFFLISIDLLCFLDFSGYFRHLNPAWETTLGFSRGELMSKPFIEFVHPDDRERTLAQNKAVRGGGQARLFENRYLCKDGSYRWLLWNAAPDTDHRVIYSVARDITDRKRADEERETLVHDLQTALAEVRTLQKILPICSYCRKIRDDANYWQTVESYIAAHTDSHFSHGICPSCYKSEVEPQFGDRHRD